MSKSAYFWTIVNESTKEKSKEKQRAFIFKRLMGKSIDEIHFFKTQLNEIEKETMNHSNFKLVFRLAGIGDSFDTECYFSSWLVSLGEQKWKMILEDPTKITELVNLEDGFIDNYRHFTHELFSYIPVYVLEKKGFKEVY